MTENIIAFFLCVIDLILPAAFVALGSTQTLTAIGTRGIAWRGVGE